MRLFVSMIGLSLVVATAAFAQTAPDPSASPATPTVEKKKEKRICRDETPTGSHFPVKVCTTAEQRKAQSGVAQRAQETMQAPSPTIPN